jgi:hypothetical protein
VTPTATSFEEIESDWFSAAASAGSTLRSFFRAVEAEQAFQSLAATVRATGDITDIVGRLHELLSRDFDRTYQSPYDVAIAAYLWLVSGYQPSIARSIAQKVLDVIGDHGWWSKQIAKINTEGHRSASQVISTAKYSTQFDASNTRPFLVAIPLVDGPRMGR